MTNKLGMVLGAAAIAVVAGCMDPNYKKPAERGQNQATPAAPVEAVEPVVTPDVTPVPPATEPVVEVVTVEQGCQCLPGTVHLDAPCACGAADCKCEVAQTPAPAVAPAPVAPAEAAPAPAEPVATTTPYIVQPGDYLAKISKKFNIKLDALRKANPQLKNDVVRLGQTIQLPGQVDVGEQKVPAAAFAQPAPKPAYKPYEGETREYVVKSGDYLGKIAAASHISVRQLKELNGLQSDMVRVGQKLKVPATAATPAVAAKPVEAPKKVEPQPVAEPVVAAPAEPVEPTPAVDEVLAVATAVEEAAAAPSAPADDSILYMVQEGEDITAISIAFGLDPAVIRDMNNMGDQDQVKPGQTIRLPPDAQ